MQTAKYFIENASENEALDEEERQFVHEQDLRRLEEMVGYCKTSGCLRAYLLRYFGEEAPERCGNCANCVGEWIRQDITVEAQKILSGVVRVEKKYPTGLGLTQIIAMLRGSKNQRVLQLGLDKLSTYGIMHGVDQKQLREYVEFLIDSGYLYLTQGEYPVLRATPQAREVLFHGETVEYSRRVPSVQEKKLPTSRPQKGGSGTGGAGGARPAGTAGGGKPLRGAARPAQRAFAEAEHPGVSDLHQRLADRYGCPPAGHDGGISAGLRRGRV